MREPAAPSFRAAWPALVLAACVTAVIVIAGDYHLFLVDFMFPTGDAASNDILITDAKHFALLHGNYSRVGFYHPGPFYLQWMALFELAFVDGLPIFASPFAAQLFALAVLNAAAIGLNFFAWQRLLERAWLAGLATAMTVAATLTVIGQNYFLVAWPPYMYVPSALIVASSLIGLLSHDPRWLPVLLCGLLQLVHGHASFIGLAPAMMAVAIATAVLLGTLPSSALRPAFAWASARAHRRLLFVSLAVLAVFIAPLAANTVLNWPGEFPKYFAFAGSPRTHGPVDAAKYVAALVPAYGLWLLAFLLPAPRSSPDRAHATRLRNAGVILLATAAIPAWLYAWRGVDTLNERYLIFWMLPFLGASLAAGVIHFASRLPMRARTVTLGLAAIATVYGLAPFRTSDLEARRARIGRETRKTAEAVGAVAGAIPRGHTLALQIDGQSEAWTRAWPDVVALIAALHRQGVDDVCVEQSSWHLLFHPRYRCSGANVSRLLYVTTSERAQPGWKWELERAVIGPAKAPEVGTTAFGNALSESGIVLFGDWSSPEDWGVWSSGRRAAFGLDASRLPAHFHLEVTTRMFPPARELRAQTVRVVDASGHELATLSNGEPSAPLRLCIDRGSNPGDVVMVSFIVDSPVSPLALGLGADDRELGVGLETITISD